MPQATKQALMAGLLAAVVTGAAGAAAAQNALKIGVLNDQASIYADVAGRGSVLAAEMDVADFGGKVLGRSIGVLSAATQNKTALGARNARRWSDSEIGRAT